MDKPKKIRNPNKPKPWERPRQVLGDWGDSHEDFERKWEMQRHASLSFDSYLQWRKK